MEIQVTLFDKNKKYKPVSAIVKRFSALNEQTQPQIIKEGVEKICIQHSWDKTDLKKYNYTIVKVRVYDQEKIRREAEERYQKIKEEKYASGEWKRPNKGGK